MNKAAKLYTHKGGRHGLENSVFNQILRNPLYPADSNKTHLEFFY